MAQHNKWQRNISAILATSILAGALSGCTISDDPLTNAVATAATIGVASLLFFNTSDNHYYDRDYNRLPRDYRPSRNARIERIRNYDDYRRYRNDYDRCDYRDQRDYRDRRDWRDDNRREYPNRWYNDNPQRMMWLTQKSTPQQACFYRYPLFSGCLYAPPIRQPENEFSKVKLSHHSRSYSLSHHNPAPQSNPHLPITSNPIQAA